MRLSELFTPRASAILSSVASSASVLRELTCDSIDRLPEPLALPEDLAAGDFLLFEGMGAYSRALVTGFNGYGVRRVVEIETHR